MRKKLILGMAVIGASVAVLGGCGASTNTASTETTASEETTSAAETTTTAETTTSASSTENTTVSSETTESTSSNAELDIGKTISYEAPESDSNETKWDITFTDIKSSDTITGYDFYDETKEVDITPESGKKYVVASLTLKNTGKRAQTFGGAPSPYALMDLIYDENYEFSPNTITDDINDKGLINSALPNMGINVDPLSEKKGMIIFEVPAEVADTDKKLEFKIYDAMNSNDKGTVFRLR